MKLRNILLVSGAVLASALVVHAQIQGGGAKKANARWETLAQRFKELDKNDDQKLVRDELGLVLFEFLNTDGDAWVTLDEVRQSVRDKGMPALQAAVERNNPTTTVPSSATELATQAASSTASLREGPQRIAAGDHGVGRMVPDLHLKDIDGQTFALSDLKDASAIVIAMSNTTCPVCKKYAPTLAALEQRFKDKHVAFIYVNPTASEKIEDLRTAIRNQGLIGKYVRDNDGAVALAIGAMRTTDTVVLDAKRTMVYRGAVDDQYGFGYSTDAPRANYLADAIEATLRNERPTVAATSAPGCPLDLSSAPRAAVASQVTYHNRVSRILQSHCLVCHREGGVAPFALSSFEEVASQSGAIRQVIEKGVMPPWFAAAPAEGEVSPFANDCSLARSDKVDLMAWLDGGKPEGNPIDAPIPRTFVAGWQIGEPDHIVQLPTPIAVKATGTMPYQNVTVDAGLAETKYLKAIEVKPSAREVVHHILVFVAPPAKRGTKAASGGDEQVDETSGFFAAYAPGYDALRFNEGYGKVLPAGSRLKFQIHYTPNGTATTDQPVLGMIFCDQPPEHLVDVTGVAQHRLAIPPHAANHEVVATQKVPNDATILAFFPHMHLRGKAFKYEALLPSGESKLLLDIPRYDFNWQLSYRFAEPVRLPAGSTLRATAWYDNSAGNLANPDPNRTVRWGQQTYDEMMIGYVEYHMPEGSMGRGARIAEIRDQLSSGKGYELLFKRMDSNGDGKIAGQELPVEQLDRLMKLDTNGDGAISLEEAKRLAQFRQ